MERDVDRVMMNVNSTAGVVLGVATFSARMSFKMLSFIGRLAYKGLVSLKSRDRFKNFIMRTEGKYSVFNIPVSGEEAAIIKQLGELELQHQKANPIKKKSIEKQIKQLEKQLPELEQLKKLGIDFCALPKLNGSEQTIQVAVSNKSTQHFQNWFVNHITGTLKGGEQNLEGLNVFTEGSYKIMSFEIENKDEIEAMLKDFETLGINYAKMPDLNVGDGYTQFAIPNADTEKTKAWFEMFQKKQIKEGKEPKQMLVLSNNSYMSTGKIGADEYINKADATYQAVQEEFEAESKKVPWTAGLEKENSERFIEYQQNENYDKITINRETLIGKREETAFYQNLLKDGVLTCRIPGTWGEREELIMLPTDRVFKTDNEKTFVAFIPKDTPTVVLNSKGEKVKRSCKEIYESFSKVTRNLHKVEDMQQGMKVAKDIAQAVPKPTMPKL